MPLPDRAARMAGMIRRELVDLLQHEVRDPRLAAVAVTGVELSVDLRLAKVHVRVDADQKQPVLKSLSAARGFLRTKLGASLRLRAVPQLQFRLDDSHDKALRIGALLDGRGGSGGVQ